jgi:ABC-type phosphate transport system substrate-binding protein
MTSRKVVGMAAALVGLLAVGCGTGVQDEIIRVSRQNNSGTYHYFREEVLGKAREFKSGSLDMSGSKDVVELVARTPGAVGYSGMGYATDEVKMLEVSKDSGEPVGPTVESASSGDYPLARPLYIYVLGEPTGAVKHYIDWIKSHEGQDIVAEIGYVPVNAITPEQSDSPPEATITISGSDTMVNLAQAWAETYGQKFAQVRPEVAGGGSGVGIAKLIDGTVEMANASREMKPEEREKAEANSGEKVVEITVALDALAVYVHKENPLDSISLEELAEIFGDGGTIKVWTQVTGWPIDVQ